MSAWAMHGGPTQWAPALGRPIAPDEHLIVVASRAGLGRLLRRTAASPEPVEALPSERGPLGSGVPA
jgi:hypothetical protein